MTPAEQQSGLGTPRSRVKHTGNSSKQHDTSEDGQINVPAGAINLLERGAGRNQPQAVPPADDDTEPEYDDPWPGRLPSSSIKYQSIQRPAQPLPPGEYLINGRRVIVEAPYIIPKRASAAISADTAGYETKRRPRAPTFGDEESRHNDTRSRSGHRPHWAVILGTGMLLMLGLWQGAVWLSNWWTIHQQDVTFGRPRTYQFDAVVGHNDSLANPTHFILINLNRKIVIYEEPGGDPAKTILYPGSPLYGDGQDLTPIVGRVYDLLGNGKQDLIIYIQNKGVIFIYINSGTKFTAATPDQMQHIRHIPPPPNP